MDLGIPLMNSLRTAFPTLLLTTSSVSSESTLFNVLGGVNVWFISVLMKRLVIIRLYLLPPLSKVGTRKFQNFVMRHLPFKVIRDVLEVVDAVHETSLEIIESRKKALEAGGDVMDKQVGRGKDMMSILCKSFVLFSGFRLK